MTRFFITRFFIDHGVVHDRKTGQHVGLSDEPGAAERLLALLLTLESEIADSHEKNHIKCLLS